MAEEETEEVENSAKEGDEEASEKSGKPLIKWIVIAVVVLLVIGGGIFGWLMFTKSDESGKKKKVVAAKKETQEVPFGKIFSLETFVVNLSDPGGRRYLKIKIDLELASGEIEAQVSTRLSQLRDVILLHLSSKLTEDIQGTTGKIALRNELIMRLNQALKKRGIRNLYFTEFVVQ